jgi:hypothetical protein
MKSLRITGFIAAAYYLMHFGTLFFISYMAQFTKQMAPATAIDGNPVWHLRESLSAVAMTYAPWLLVGMAVWLLLAIWIKKLWRATPFIAALLLAGGIAWGVGYYLALQPYYTELSNTFNNAPGMNGVYGNYMRNMMSASQANAAYPLLLPGIVLFIFWWKARKEAAASAGEVLA